MEGACIIKDLPLIGFISTHFDHIGIEAHRDTRDPPRRQKRKKELLGTSGSAVYGSAGKESKKERQRLRKHIFEVETSEAYLVRTPSYTVYHPPIHSMLPSSPTLVCWN